MRQFETGAIRDAIDYERWDLISPVGLRRLAEVCAEDTRDGIPASVLLNHAIQHVYLYLAGDLTDDHLARAARNLLCACHLEETQPALVDIPSRHGIPGGSANAPR